MNLARVDLNLLLSLDALLTECNVTKAAARLHISQPALSAQLARLRDVFSDPLLLPAQSGRGMTPTARALALQGPLRTALKNVEGVLNIESTFDPLADDRIFRIAIGDSALGVIGLPLIASLAAETGENVRAVLSVPEPKRIAAHMEDGDIDLLIDSERIVPGGLHAQLLFEEPFVMAQRKQHPRGKRPLKVDAYCALRHIVVSPERTNIRGDMDAYLENQGKRRNTVLSVPQFMMVPEILRTSDYVCTLPRMLLAPFSDVVDLFRLPFPAEPFRLVMGWHARNDRDPAIAWLRDQVSGIVRETH
jgi:DNA-binding transcriptional LysR family regulator